MSMAHSLTLDHSMNVPLNKKESFLNLTYANIIFLALIQDLNGILTSKILKVQKLSYLTETFG